MPVIFLNSACEASCARICSRACSSVRPCCLTCFSKPALPNCFLYLAISWSTLASLMSTPCCDACSAISARCTRNVIAWPFSCSYSVEPALGKARFCAS